QAPGRAQGDGMTGRGSFSRRARPPRPASGPAKYFSSLVLSPRPVKRGAEKMTRETKVGLVVACSFLGLVGVVLASKLKGDETPGDPATAQVPGPPAAQVAKPPSFGPGDNKRATIFHIGQDTGAKQGTQGNRRPTAKKGSSDT